MTLLDQRFEEDIDGHGGELCEQIHEVRLHIISSLEVIEILDQGECKFLVQHCSEWVAFIGELLKQPKHAMQRHVSKWRATFTSRSLGYE